MGAQTLVRDMPCSSQHPPEAEIHGSELKPFSPGRALVTSETLRSTIVGKNGGTNTYKVRP